MSDSSSVVNEKRRNFLKLAALGSPALVAGTLAGTGTPSSAAADETPTEDGGYRKTAHVKAYLEAAKF